MAARRKAPGGLTRVLFVDLGRRRRQLPQARGRREHQHRRARQGVERVDRIERARLQIERDAGVTVGQSDAARLLLDEALRERGIELREREA